MTKPTDLLGQTVVAYTAGGEAYRAGHAVSYSKHPVFGIQTDDGARFYWRADLVRPVNPACPRCDGTGLVDSNIIPGDKAPCQACVDAPEVKTCKWAVDNDRRVCGTECNRTLSLGESVVADLHFCPFCGKPIEVVE